VIDFYNNRFSRDHRVTSVYPPTSLADRIRALPRALGITQAMLAERAGMGPSQLSALLRRLESRPLAVELETVTRIAEAGGVSAFWLLFGEAAPEGSSRALPLRLHAAFQRQVDVLRRRGHHMPDALLAWLGEVVLPFDAPGQLTPEVLASLATLRLQMIYGSGALAQLAPPYAPYAPYSPFPPMPEPAPTAPRPTRRPPAARPTAGARGPGRPRKAKPSATVESAKPTRRSSTGPRKGPGRKS